jgi:hypothetical protein
MPTQAGIELSAVPGVLVERPPLPRLLELDALLREGQS